MSEFSRRSLLLSLAALPLLRACSSPAEAAVFHDVGCGCCLKWVEKFRSEMPFGLSIIERETRDDLHAQFGIMPQLASCHTAVIDGFAFEGHVPPADIRRFLATRPAGYVGLAVPGMPMGSPGMEQGEEREHFDVIAFGSKQMSVFATY